jgi:hypothetical protein
MITAKQGASMMIRSLFLTAIFAAAIAQPLLAVDSQKI